MPRGGAGRPEEGDPEADAAARGPATSHWLASVEAARTRAPSRQVAARRQFAQRGYDVANAAGWSADDMTNRANRTVDELAAGR
jgi:hypothetical protein